MNIDKLLNAIPAMTPQERKTQRENAERALRSEKGALHEPARRILSAIDAHEVGQNLAEERARETVREHARSLPLTERIIAAFTAEEMTETERKVIQVVLDLPGAPSPELTRSAGWRNKSWHMHFGKMCRKREHLLGLAPTYDKKDDKFFSGILCDFDRATSGFTLKPEALAAFAQLGLAGRPNKATV